MLRLVHPAPAGNVPAPSHHRRSPALSLTDEEVRHVRAAVRGAARSFGSLQNLAAALGVGRKTLSAKHRPAAGLAVALARLTGLSLDAMLSGRLTEAGVCPACGGKRAAGAS
jgi:hypothetical protein